MVPWTHRNSHPKWNLDQFSHFCTDHGKGFLYNGPTSPFLLKIAHLCAESGYPSNTCFLGPTWVHNPNGISTGSAIFAGSLLWQTNRPTDHTTRFVTVGCIYICSTAMQPNNEVLHNRRVRQLRTLYDDWMSAVTFVTCSGEFVERSADVAGARERWELFGRWTTAALLGQSLATALTGRYWYWMIPLGAVRTWNPSFEVTPTALATLFLQWLWTLTDDLDLRTWPR